MENTSLRDYILTYIAIIDCNLKKKTKVIPLKELVDMLNDLNDMLNEYYLEETGKCSEIARIKYLPILKMIMQQDKSKENRGIYQNFMKNAFRMSSYNSLHHYMLYREWDEKDKFYLPRLNIMQGYIHYLQELDDVNSSVNLVICNMPSGYGKLIANDVPVLTKDGWKKHGDLKVGDYVIGKQGQFVRVNIVHPKRLATVKVVFEDGEEILCHNQHEWNVYDREAQKEKERVETNYLMEHLKSKGNRNRFYIPLCNPVIGEEKKLPVDPYTYGVWLGDGSTNQPRITQNKNDLKIFEYIPYQIGKVYKGASENVDTYQIDGLAKDLHKLGLCYQKHKEEKYIHDSYLTANINQRLELLAGLIDTDGHLDKQKNRYIITTCGEKLKNDIVSLVSTFHWRVCVTKVEPKTSTSGVIGRNITYYISFSPTMYIPCKLERKQLHKFSKQKRIGIARIEHIPVTEGNCITVDGGLYLVGKTLKLTHNTYPEKISEAWSFGKDPTGTILSLCSNVDVVKGGSATVRDEMKSEKFGDVFPKMRFSKEDKEYFLKETDGNWKLRDCKLVSSYYADTVNSNVVGERASKRIHIDDLYADYLEAMNQNTNELYFNRFTTVWKKRFIQNAVEKVVVTGTLWASGDFIARLIESEEKDHQFEEDKKYPYTRISEDGTVVIIQVPALDYKTGLSTCPELRTTEAILKERSRIDEYLFQTNFQQRPVDPEAMEFSNNRLRYYDKKPPRKDAICYAVIDATRKSGKDFFAMPILQKVYVGEDEYDYALIDCIFTRTATKDMYQEVVNKIMEYRIITLVIESNVTSELKQNIETILGEYGINYCDIREKYNVAKKEERIEAQKSNIRRKIVFPERNLFPLKSDIGSFMDNLIVYNSQGRNINDDAPDSLAMFCSEIMEGGSLPARVKPIRRPF